MNVKCPDSDKLVDATVPDPRVCPIARPPANIFLGKADDFDRPVECRKCGGRMTTRDYKEKTRNGTYCPLCGYLSCVTYKQQS